MQEVLMSWIDFINKLKSTPIHCTEPVQPSRYGSMPDLYFTAILPSSTLPNNDSNSCFVTIGISDLAGSALFMDEPNIIVIDWNKNVLNTIETRIQELHDVFKSENYEPHKLAQNTMLLENTFSFPYDFEFWERMNMALLEHYRKIGDFRARALQQELESGFFKYTELYEKLKILNRHSKYIQNEFERESMDENSIENKRLLLGERYFKLNLKIFFKYIDQELLQNFANKNITLLDLNILNLDAVNKFVALLEKSLLVINRINFTDMLDDIVVAPENLETFVIVLEKFRPVLAKQVNLIFNHINNFSLAISLDNTLLRLEQISSELAAITKDNTSLAIPTLEEYAATYLLSFRKYSNLFISKENFYSK
jgi:hypothetical protein